MVLEISTFVTQYNILVFLKRGLIEINNLLAKT